MRTHQQQLQELITSQQTAWATAEASAGPAVKVVDAAESDHPVLVSFPSFSDTAGRLTGSLAAEQPHASTEQDSQAAAQHDSLMRPAGQQPASAVGLQHSVWAGSSSSCESPPQHGVSAGSCQHSSSNSKRTGVSLLSQQIACARTLTAASVPSPGDVDAIEAAGGASGRQQRQFWQYIKVGLGGWARWGWGWARCGLPHTLPLISTTVLASSSDCSELVGPGACLGPLGLLQTDPSTDPTPAVCIANMPAVHCCPLPVTGAASQERSRAAGSSGARQA